MRRVVGIAHTELNMKSFDISYVPSSLDAWQETGAIVEVEVKSDRLRLIKGQNDLVVEEPKIDESTGNYSWSLIYHYSPRLSLFCWLFLLPSV